MGISRVLPHTPRPAMALLLNVRKFDVPNLVLNCRSAISASSNLTTGRHGGPAIV